MATFTIDRDNDITGYAPGETVPDGSTELFTTESELPELAAHRPAARLVEVWTTFPASSLSGSSPPARRRWPGSRLNYSRPRSRLNHPEFPIP